MIAVVPFLLLDVDIHFILMEVGPRGGVLPYMGHIGMCRCEGYGFQAVYSSIGRARN